MKRLPLIILGIILFGYLAIYVIIPAAVILIKILIATGIALVFGLGVWLGYAIGKNK